MTGYQEPPDGDFVAYIDELQRQSAARISAAADRPMHEAAPHRFACDAGRVRRGGKAGAEPATG